MRVLQVIAGGDYGGAEAFYLRLVLALHRAGLEQRAVIRTNQRRATILREGGMAPIQLRFGGPLDIASRLGMRRAIRDFRPNLVLTWMNRATNFCPRSRQFIHVGRIGGYYDVKYYKNCDHVIGNTEDIVGYLQNAGWPAERTHYLPNFVDGELAQPASRAELYTPANAPLLLALGRLHESKGFDVLIRALELAPNAYLWIAGEGKLRSQLEAQALRSGVKPRIRFLGWRDDVSALLAAADVFVCSSRHEPLGNVVIEAWAQGCPVISTDSQGPGELISQMRNGILVPVDDAQTMGKAITYLFNDNNLLQMLSRNGRESYEKGFTENLVVRKYMEFFEKSAA
jgi:glycosyltransferase involved in cell wall biosynthesis